MIILKIILWTLLAVLLIAAAALAVPTRVYFHLSDDMILQVRYLFFKIPIPITDEQKAAANAKKAKKASRRRKKTPQKKSPQPPTENSSAAEAEKPQKKKKQKKEKKENPAVKWLSTKYKQGGVQAIIDGFKEIADLVIGTLKPIFKNITLRRLDIDITAASEDAAETAISYGKLCAGIYPALSVILRVVKFGDYSVSIHPDFDKKKLETNIVTELSLVPWVVIPPAVRLLVGYIKMKMRDEI